MDVPANEVGPSYVSGIGIADRCPRVGDLRVAPLISVGPMPVVVLEVPGEDGFEVVSEYEDPVEALAADGSDKALGDRVRPRTRIELFTTLMPSAEKTVSKEEVNLVSRSRIKNLAGDGRPVSS